MSTNGVNSSEDTDMADCDGEKVVTMMDVLQEQQDFEEDANAVLGASDDKNCTFSKGYIKRQAVYACMTCCSGAKEDDTKRAGVCLACCLSCHENHELVELYTKRNFRCDCGNPKFNSHPCKFNSNKNDINEDNIYNQNYSGLYCICHRPYPDPETNVQDEMIQCIICEDWLHASHLDAIIPPNDQYSEMICKGCMEKNVFLHDYSGFAVSGENAEVDVVSTNDVTTNDVSINGTADSVLETSKENAEHNVSVCEDVDTKDKSDNKIKDDTNKDTAPTHITESNSITDSDRAEQTKEESNTGTIIQNENETKDNNAAHTSAKLENNQEVNASSELIGGTQEVPEKINVEEAKSNENPSEMSSVSTNENEVKDTDKTENVLDNNKSEIADKHLIKEENSNQSTEIGDVEMKEAENLEEKAVENKQDEDSKCNTETPTEEQLKDELTSAPESENPENNTNTDDQEKTKISSLTKDDTKVTETGLTKLSEEAETVNPSESNLNTMNAAYDNESKDEAMHENCITEENKITKEDPPIFDNVREESDNKSKDELSTTENIRKENGTQEEKLIVDQPEDSEADVVKQKDHSDNGNKDPTETMTNTNENKRKLSMDEDKDNVVIKKLKGDEESLKSCVRPKDGKKHFKGATFWPSSFRQKLCTCNECLAMYKDLSVLFLTDTEDTVSAYEMLGKEKTDGSPSSQYEKGLQALSSLDRIQQINALTEYNKMRDKLLDFLKSFKDRREIVKEEDIKGFFAGMKPKREPDGVYFCR